MNQDMSNFNQDPNQDPAAQGGWAPQPSEATPANVPFEPTSTEGQMASEIPTGAYSSDPSLGYQSPQAGAPETGVPAMETTPQPKGGANWFVIILVVLILGLGGVVFASWKGLIDLGPLNSIFGGKSKEATSTQENVNPVTARDRQRKQDLVNLKTALKKYYTINQAYPVAANLQKTTDTNGALSALIPGQLEKLPVDPMYPTYYYGYKSDGKTFEITAVLEDNSDPSGIQVGNYLIYKVTDNSIETPAAPSNNSSTTTTSGSNTTGGSSAQIK